MKPGDDAHAVAFGSGVNTRAGCRRIAEHAFEYAVNHARKKVTIVHKSNILKALTGSFWRPPKKWESVNVPDRGPEFLTILLAHLIQLWQPESRPSDLSVWTNFWVYLIGDLGGSALAALAFCLHRPEAGPRSAN